MAGSKNGLICKNLIQNDEHQRYSWGTQKKKKKKTAEALPLDQQGACVFVFICPTIILSELLKFMTTLQLFLLILAINFFVPSLNRSWPTIIYNFPVVFAVCCIDTQVGFSPDIHCTVYENSNLLHSYRPPIQPTLNIHNSSVAVLVKSPPCWPSGKASASRAADLGAIPTFAVDLFPGLRHTCDIQTGNPVAILQGTWCYLVCAGTGWPCVSIL